MSLFYKKLKSKKGQSIVEFALLLPLLLLMIAGIIDFGRIMNTYLVANYAAREGVRQAALGQTDTVITDTVKGAASTLDPDTIQVGITPGKSLRVRGAQTTVTVIYQIDEITPIINKIIPNPFIINTSTSMRIE